MRQHSNQTADRNRKHRAILRVFTPRRGKITPLKSYGWERTASINPNNRAAAGRTPLNVAAFASHDGTLAALVMIGANSNLLENDKHDIITIVAVANDAKFMAFAIRLRGTSGNITSVYDGKALITAAHLVYVEFIQALIKGRAPLDHVNNLD